MRLIDADSLCERMYHEAFENDSDMQKWDSGCWIRYKLFENVIQTQPTIKPEHLKGKWIKKDDGDGTYYMCSVCNELFTLIDGTPFDNKMYSCPNCGARMGE